MKPEPNFFYVNRSLLNSDRWLSEKFTRGQAWVDMFGLANHKNGFVRVRGIKIPIGRGQLGWSQESLAARWGWSRGKVNRYLNELENDGDIVQQTDSKITIISIKKYDFWQGNNTENGTTNGQQTVQQTDTNKNNKKNNNLDTNVSNGVSRRNPFVEIVLSEFQSSFSFKPTDKRPRFVAHNFSKNIQAFLKVFNPEITEARFTKVIRTYLDWLLTQDYANKIETLDLVRRKFSIWSDPQVTSYQKGKDATTGK